MQKVKINSLTQEQIDNHLESLVAAGFYEGVLWCLRGDMSEKSLDTALAAAKYNIVHNPDYLCEGK